MKKIIIKDCFECPESEIWPPFGVFKCNKTIEEDGYNKVIPGPPKIPVWCPLDTEKE